MSLFLNTRGESVLGIGICARCSKKFPLLQLQPDRNSPGLLVCEKDNDEFDPYRLPPRQPDNIVLPFNRPDLPLDVPARNCTHYILASETPQGLQADGQPGWSPQPGLQVDSLLGAQLCDRQDGTYGGQILTIPLGVEITDPLVEVVLTWPLDVGFEVDHFEVYAYYDIANPTAADLVLVATFGPTVGGYTDTHGYTTNFGYTVVAVGVNGQRAYTPGVTYFAPFADATASADCRALANDLLFNEALRSTIAPSYRLNNFSTEILTNYVGITAYRDIMTWLNNRLYWTPGYGNTNQVFFCDSDGSNQSSESLTDGGDDFFPYSVRPELGVGATTGRLWLGGMVAIGPGPTFRFEAAIAPMDGITNPSANIVRLPGSGPLVDTQVFDAWSWDGGATVLCLYGVYDVGVGTNNRSRIISYDTTSGIFTTLFTSSVHLAGGAVGNLAKNESGVYLAVTPEYVFRSIDGVTWTETASPGWNISAAPRVYSGRVGSVDAFVVVIPQLTEVWYSTNGITWTQADTSSVVMAFFDVAITNDTAILVGQDDITGLMKVASMKVLGQVRAQYNDEDSGTCYAVSVRQTN